MKLQNEMFLDTFCLRQVSFRCIYTCVYSKQGSFDSRSKQGTNTFHTTFSIKNSEDHFCIRPISDDNYKTYNNIFKASAHECTKHVSNEARFQCSTCASQQIANRYVLQLLQLRSPDANYLRIYQIRNDVQGGRKINAEIEAGRAFQHVFKNYYAFKQLLIII